MSSSARTREKRRRNGGVARKKLTVKRPSHTPSMVPGLNVPEGFSGVGASLPARRLHRSHSQSHSELMQICGDTEDGTRGDKGCRASAPISLWGARLRKERTAGAVSGSGEKDGYSAYAGGNALRPSVWFGTKSSHAGRHTGYCAKNKMGQVQNTLPKRKTKRRGLRKGCGLYAQRRDVLSFPSRKLRDGWMDPFQLPGSARKIRTSAE